MITNNKIERAAALSDCGRFRWSLSRSWDFTGKWLGWVMLNPSTADASIDDPTIRRCIAFSRSWGYGAMTVMNLFPFRATHPLELFEAASLFGSHPQIVDQLMRELPYVCRDVVCAWGVMGDHLDRDIRVSQLLIEGGANLFCLGLSKSGHPVHPLYQPGSATLKPFRVRDHAKAGSA